MNNINSQLQADNVISPSDPSSKPDYQPLKSLKLPGVDVIPKGLILVVGPNSSGKTQLLKDIHALLTGEQRESVVCEQIYIEKPANLDKFVERLVQRGYIKRYRDNNGNDYVQATSPILGYGPAKGGNTSFSQINNAFATFQDGPYTTHNSKSAPFFNTLGHSLVTALFLDRRLNMVNETQNFDFEKESPVNELQSLYISRDAQANLQTELKEVFGKGVWLDSLRNQLLCLRVNQVPEIPSADERLQPQSMKGYRTIETEGDGLRSYVGIAVSLLLGLRPVCLIDEPELCLHPPQAYRMGLFIGRNATIDNQAIFASTHSSHVLRGVIEANGNVQILRMTKYGSKFKCHTIGPEELRKCMERPIIRAETILDGIFADGVVLVEADGDRAVYQAAWEAVTKGKAHRDVLYIPVGGTGGFAEIAAFYRRLKIPVAVVADLDLIADPSKLSSVLNATCEQGQRAMIMESCREIAKKLKEIPPVIKPDEVRARLQDLIDNPIDWTPKEDEIDDDVKIKRALNKLAKDVDRMRRLKVNGIEGLRDHGDLYSAVVKIVEDCKQAGIFLVPVGEVEQWEPEGVEDAPNQKRKAEWANWSSANIRENPEPWSMLKDFIKDIETFEKSEAKRIAGE